MSKQTIAVVVAAVVLFAAAVLGALAFTGDDSGAGDVHTMPNGQMMTGPTNGMAGMDSMRGHTMQGGKAMTGPMHTMSGGEEMPGMTHMPP